MSKVETGHTVDPKQVWNETDRATDGRNYDLLFVLAAERRQERHIEV